VPLPQPEPGLVICYAYLWHSEFKQGREEGVKDRPCAVVLTTQDQEGDTVVVVVPITHTPPKNPAWAVEIPAVTKERLGLDTEQSWVNVTEVNRFVWPGPDLRPISRNQSDRYDYGVLPPKLFKEIKARLLTQAEAQKMMTVTRTE
jgi:mRNA-degrading endonuclease toxin of MazEF toxin-antitoxin module